MAYQIIIKRSRAKSAHKTVLAQLSHIEPNVLSSENDLIGIPSPEKITEINQLVTTWHKALALISHDLPVIKTHKTVVMEVLCHLEAHLSEVNIISLSDPVQYDTGKFFIVTTRTKMLVAQFRSFISQSHQWVRSHHSSIHIPRDCVHRYNGSQSPRW